MINVLMVVRNDMLRQSHTLIYIPSLPLPSLPLPRIPPTGSTLTLPFHPLFPPTRKASRTPPSPNETLPPPPPPSEYPVHSNTPNVHHQHSESHALVAPQTDGSASLRNPRPQRSE